MKVYCPRCGQEQISSEIRFCSRCGFLMNGISQMVLSGGVPEQLTATGAKPPSARRRGVKQGGGMILLGAFVVPLLGVLSMLLNFDTTIVGLAAVILFLGGFLRLIYAAIFESGNPTDKTLEENVIETVKKLSSKKKNRNALPSPQSIPVDAYEPPRQANWRDTNDLEAAQRHGKHDEISRKTIIFNGER